MVLQNKAKVNSSLGFIEIFLKEGDSAVKYKFFNHPDNQMITRIVDRNADYNSSGNQEYRTNFTIKVLDDFYETYNRAQFGVLSTQLINEGNFQRVFGVWEWIEINAGNLTTVIGSILATVFYGAIVVKSGARNFF